MTESNGSVMPPKQTKQAIMDAKRLKRLLNRIFGFKDGIFVCAAIRETPGDPDEPDIRILLNQPTREGCELMGRAVLSCMDRYPTSQKEAPREDDGPAV